MMEEKSRILLLLSLMFIFTEVSSLSSCEESARTVRAVERCPTDSESWEMAAKNMNCGAIKQNCSQSSNRHHFQYHCVINAWMNETLEVCALNRTIFGFCTEYNVMGRVIQENYYAYCKDLDPPCPSFYNSAEAYKYQSCYQLVKKNHQKIEYSNEDIKKPVIHVLSTSKGLHGDIAVIFLSILHACVL
nr:uncharacterized protein LOC117690691 isoform X3 [Crassostrea gigas]